MDETSRTNIKDECQGTPGEDYKYHSGGGALVLLTCRPSRVEIRLASSKCLPFSKFVTSYEALHMSFFFLDT